MTKSRGRRRPPDLDLAALRRRAPARSVSHWWIGDTAGIGWPTMLNTRATVASRPPAPAASTTSVPAALVVGVGADRSWRADSSTGAAVPGSPYSEAEPTWTSRAAGAAQRSAQPRRRSARWHRPARRRHPAPGRTRVDHHGDVAVGDQVHAAVPVAAASRGASDGSNGGSHHGHRLDAVVVVRRRPRRPLQTHPRTQHQHVRHRRSLPAPGTAGISTPSVRSSGAGSLAAHGQGARRDRRTARRVDRSTARVLRRHGDLGHRRDGERLAQGHRRHARGARRAAVSPTWT